MKKDNFIDKANIYEFCLNLFYEKNSKCKINNYYLFKILNFKNNSLELIIIGITNKVIVNQLDKGFIHKSYEFDISNIQFKHLSQIFNEKILCASIYFVSQKIYKNQPINIETGFTLEGYRHDNCYSKLDIFGKDFDLTDINKFKEKNNISSVIAGFLTSNNRFVSRENAGTIAFKCKPKQVIEKDIILFSEDLY